MLEIPSPPRTDARRSSSPTLDVPATPTAPVASADRAGDRPAPSPLRRARTAARHVYRLARGAELRAPFPLREKLGAWLDGFSAGNAAMYSRTSDAFARGDRADFLTDYARWFRCVRLNPDRTLFDNKLALRAVLLHRGVAQPETIALLADRRVLLHPLDADARYLTPAELESWLRADGGRFVQKPHNGAQGRDVYLLETRDGVLVRRRGKETRPTRASDFVADGSAVTLVERLVDQGPFWRALSPESANCIRAFTLWTPGAPAPFLARAVQRIGTAATAPTDNWSGGGVGAAIDLDTGRLGVGRRHPLKCGDAPVTCTHHPDSGARIEGAVVPHWERVRAGILHAAASLPLNRHIGWDVIVDAAGTPVLIEGNGNPDINGLQVHGGLLADPAVRRFYEASGVL